MTDLSVLDMSLDDITEPRSAPDGQYVAQVVGVENGIIPNEKKTKYADVQFKLIEATSGQDLTGVNLARPVYGRIWLSPNSLGNAKRDLKKFGVDFGPGEKIKDALEKIVGATVVVTVSRDEYAEKKGNDKAIVSRWNQA